MLSYHFCLSFELLFNNLCEAGHHRRRRTELKTYKPTRVRTELLTAGLVFAVHRLVTVI